jgi:endoglucanase
MPKLPYYTGVNLAGADFAPDQLPGTYRTHYIYPTHAEIDYFTGKGMNVFRLPFLWERLQHTQFGDFDAVELARIDDFVNYATGKGASVVLDPHNYARYYGTESSAQAACRPPRSPISGGSWRCATKTTAALFSA